MSRNINVEGLNYNNLVDLNVQIPRNRFVVFTGVSGSGKSSLVYDVLFREAEFQYLELLAPGARHLLSNRKRADYKHISGLSPVISIHQNSYSRNPRSTVGTLSGMYDLLRLLFSRFADQQENKQALSREHFSFNSDKGWCGKCKGLGLEDYIDINKIIKDENLSLREGCFYLTTSNSYIMYSQVTINVLDQVCRSEGFTVDIPWKDLNEDQKKVILYGSSKIEIPFGKHELESRLKWKGITPKPREMGYYKGIIPVMEGILSRERNPSIMRYTSTHHCTACQGKRLNHQALACKIENLSIDDVTHLPFDQLKEFIRELKNSGKFNLAIPVLDELLNKLTALIALGYGYLKMAVSAPELSGAEIQAIRMAEQINNPLHGLIFVFDEPSKGLHPEDNLELVRLFKKLRDQGNSILCIEHDETIIRQADYLVDMGPGPGQFGGNIIYQGPLPPDRIPEESLTLRYLYRQNHSIEKAIHGRHQEITLTKDNAIEADFKSLSLVKDGINVLCGKPGSGRKELVEKFILPAMEGKTRVTLSATTNIKAPAYQIIRVDSSPIGKTSRSNPATYTAIWDEVRSLFAALPESKAQQWGKSRFSFNVKGGRCNLCEGSGSEKQGLHFMGSMDLVCPECHGKRFNAETLKILYRGKSVSDILDLSIDEAAVFFAGNKKIEGILLLLRKIGLGYLSLGQKSSSLSGGEVQRLKLASELWKNKRSGFCYYIPEASNGLHPADIHNLMSALNDLSSQGNTFVLIDNDLHLLSMADHIIEVERAPKTNTIQVLSSGTIETLKQSHKSRFKNYWPAENTPRIAEDSNKIIQKNKEAHSIQLKGIQTNNLKGIDLEIQENQYTVITGVSGSGKSSLAMDSLFNECRQLFLEHYSAYFRNRLGIKHLARVEEASGLMAPLAIDQEHGRKHKRSTLGTQSGIYAYLRLLFSRVAQKERAQEEEARPWSDFFSFNSLQGACPHCGGLGKKISCDPEKLIRHPELSLLNGAMAGTKPGEFYGDPYGRHMAILKTLAHSLGTDLERTWNELDAEFKSIVLYGTGNKEYDIQWDYKRGKRTGSHRFTASWKGLIHYINEEYSQKQESGRLNALMPVMSEYLCDECKGKRLNKKVLEYKINGAHIAGVASLSIANLEKWLKNTAKALETLQNTGQKGVNNYRMAAPLIDETIQLLQPFLKLGLAYLSIDRPIESLSGGEFQRARLARLAGSGMTGMLVVLDEPSIGLHRKNIAHLMNLVRDLCRNGNTVVAVEHDRGMILKADKMIELGPGPGRDGGRIIFEGKPEEALTHPDSVIGSFLGELQSKVQSRSSFTNLLRIEEAWAHNLKYIDVQIPGNQIVAITGVSGSGKSSLVFDVLEASLAGGRAVSCKALHLAQEQDFELVSFNPDLSLPGSTSFVASFMGIFDDVRKLYAQQAKENGSSIKYTDLSLNKKGLRCERCEGKGYLKIDLDFLGSSGEICPDCSGKRYQDEVLETEVQGKNLFDFLNSYFNDLRPFDFGMKINSSIRLMCQSGLGYLKPGQATQTLSGGEFLRLNLVAGLNKKAETKQLILLDEPGRGLHFKDIDKLMALLHEYRQNGHHILLIEHKEDIIRQCDWIIELGPGSADEGGRIIFDGPVQDYPG